MRLGIICSALIALALLAGCAHTDIDRNGAVRPNPEKRALDHASAKTLYHSARGDLDSGNPAHALLVYDKLQTRYPFSDYATQAQMEIVYAHYAAQQYQAALSAADRFIKQHPRNPHIDYVYYLRGLANYDRGEGNSLLGSRKSERDPTHLRQAFTDFNLLIRNFPDSIYNKDAQLRMIEIKHRLAKHEMSVAEYYLRRHAWVAASRRAEYVLAHYQGADSVPRALEIMEQCYRDLGLEALAEDTRAVLQTSYPNYIVNRTEFYRQRAGLAPRYKLPPMGGSPKETKKKTATGGGEVSSR